MSETEDKDKQMEDFEETAAEFKKQMENLANLEVAPYIRQFAEMIEALKQDEDALQRLREEIVKHYGE